MQPRCSGKGNRALTLFEVLLVIAILMIMAAFILPALKPRPIKYMRISCANNLKQIGLSYRVWAGDNNDKYPMQVSITNGGTMELTNLGSQTALMNYLVMSNELSTPKILNCPSDEQHVPFQSFSAGFGNTNISYFVGLNAEQTFPQSILSGDDNLTVNGAAVPAGILAVPTNASVVWTAERHVKAGNIGLADGSAQQVTISGVNQAFQQTGFNTNRLAIP